MEAKNKKKQCYSFFLTLLVLALFGFTTTTYGQNIVITGTVSENAISSPLPGVTITIKGNQIQGTQTDFDGNYSIEVPNSQTTLVYRYLGFVTKEVLVGNQTTININLEEDTESLGEIILVGYGTQKRSDVTAAISSIKSDDLNDVVTTSLTDAMQGRVAGVTVTSSSGSPGSTADITIRGLGSFGNNQPLYIIDGVQADPYFIDNNNIESIEVLKDAAAAAIYGTRAANGVVLITSKKGKSGKPKVEIGHSLSINTIRNKMKLLDADGYINVHRQMYENAGEALPQYLQNTATHANTNWVDQTHRDGQLILFNARVSGSSEYVNYNISGNLADETGVLIGSEFSKKGINLNLGTKNTGKFKIDAAVNYSETHNEDYGFSSEDLDVRTPYKFSLRDTYFISPLIPVFDPSKPSGYGSRDGDMPDHRNPVGENHFLNGYTKLKYFLGNVNLNYEIIDGLQVNASYAVSNLAKNSHDFHKPFKVRDVDDNDQNQFAFVSEYHTELRRINQTYTLNYQFSLGKHDFNLLGGYQRINEPFKETYVQGEGYKLDDDGNKIPAIIIDSDFSTLDALKDGTFSGSGTNEEYSLVSQFGRLNYGFNDKYLVQATIRRDGSSKFGKNNRYGVFPSFALGWKITDESFMENQNVFDFLKLRYSWGQAGNDLTIDNYTDVVHITQGKDQDNGGYVFGNPQNSQLGGIAIGLLNNDLQWETNTSSNFGIDFASLSYRLKGAINYYQTTTKDLLITKELPGSVGADDPIINVGEFENSGFEFELGYTNRDHEFKYAIFGTFTTINSEVTKLAREDQVLRGIGLLFGSDHFVNQTRIGYEPGAFFLPVADGIFQNQAEIDAHGAQTANASPGDIRFVDQNNDGVINEEDEVYAGTAIPKYEYSLNFSAEYRGFDLNLFFQGVGGNKIYNANDFRLLSMDTGRNYRVEALNSWTPSNTDTDIPRAVLGDPNQNNRASTRFLENGGYLRVKTIQLGYSIPSQILDKIKMDKLRLYITGQNLFTFTNYDGLDPEVGGSIIDSEILSRGIDRNLYPKYKSMILGVQLGF
jgi:TonB-linked SusC/RagA family outer membrane protein